MISSGVEAGAFESRSLGNGGVSAASPHAPPCTAPTSSLRVGPVQLLFVIGRRRAAAIRSPGHEEFFSNPDTGQDQHELCTPNICREISRQTAVVSISMSHCRDPMVSACVSRGYGSALTRGIPR